VEINILIIMKKIFLLILLATFTIKINAQKNVNVVKVTPLTFVKGQLFMLHYERNISKKMSLGIGVAPIFRGPLFNMATLDYPPTKYNMGIAIDPEIRWYAKSNDAMDGFFVGFYNSNRFSSWQSTTNGTTFENVFDGTYSAASSFNVDVKNQKYIFGIQLGTQKMMSDNISIDFYSGLGFNVNKSSITGTDSYGKAYVDEKTGAGINLRLNLAIGYRF
jgi:hypothetical protein